MIPAIALILLGVYLACGFLFALPFVFLGVGRIDPHASHGSWGFRLLIIPGATALWPILLHRWVKGIHKPPEESTGHRSCSRLGQSGSDGKEADLSRITPQASRI
jgi:hypothetical protein